MNQWSYQNQDLPEKVHQVDVLKILDALSRYYNQADEDERPEPQTSDDLSPAFLWATHLNECLDYLVENYDWVKQCDKGYYIDRIP